MNLKLDAATSQRRDDIIRIVMAAFALFVCELVLLKWIFAQPSNQRDFVDYGFLLVLPGPFWAGLRLRRRVNTLRLTEDVSIRASAQIKSDVSVLMVATYSLLLGLWIVRSLVK